MDRVAYTPLGTSANLLDADLECETDDQPFPHSAYLYSHRGPFSSKLLGLPQLRGLLYMAAILLTLIFITQLSTHSGSSQPMKLIDNSSTSSLKQQQQSGFPIAIQFDNNNHSMGKIKSDIALEQIQKSALSSSDIISSQDKRPQYDSYLSSVLLEHNSQAQPFNDLHYPIDDQQHNSVSHNLQQQPNADSQNTSNSTTSKTAENYWWTLGERNKYITVTNYIRAMKSFKHNASITLTTQATTEFMYHTLELCERWDGPISVAVFCPGPEMAIAITLIKFMRECLPGPLNACIRDKVSWHLVYNKDHGPAPNALGYPKHHLDEKDFPLFVNQDQCPKLPGPEPADLIRQFEEELRKSKGFFITSYRKQLQLTYPINVLRNTARLAAHTEYLLASDIELYPSINLVPSFISYISSHNVKKEYGIDKYSFTLPIFEVKANVSVPKTKNELVRLLSIGDAIFFHKYVCDACQNFPNRTDWLQTDQLGRKHYQAGDSEAVIFTITIRDKSREFWEPIFIGTNEDPLYDDRLTWEGRRDKMAQMYQMCLQNYQLLILGNAFLVHAPGIKHIDKKDNMKRLNYIIGNNAIFDATMSELKKEYSNSSNINKC